MTQLLTGELSPGESVISRSTASHSTRSKRHVAQFDAQGCADYLRALYPFAPAANVAALINGSDRTVQNFLRLRCAPSAQIFIPMLAQLGPGFIAASMTRSPEWLERCNEDEARRQLEFQKAALEKQLARMR